MNSDQMGQNDRQDPLSFRVLTLLPTNVLSRAFGWLAERQIPLGLRPLLMPLFARALRINAQEAALPLPSYHSLQALFTRELKPGLRPIGVGLISPVDAELRSVELVTEGQLSPTKGQRYTVAELLGENGKGLSTKYHEIYQGGRAWNLYLCPADYHHVHAPLAGELVCWRYIPGALFPVNDLGLRWVPKLFVRQERLLFFIRTPLSPNPLLVVMIGALNVGKMSSPLIPNLLKKIRSLTAPIDERLADPLALQKGQLLGTFNLGSTVVLIAPPDLTEHLGAITLLSGAVRFGESLSGATSSS